jgi:hypothetical protein
MRFRLARPLLVGLIAVFFSCAAAVADDDIPLRNWPTPEVLDRQGAGTDGSGFVAIEPCRVVDTRPSQGFPAAWGPPILAGNAIRNFDINSAPHCPGIAAGAVSYSLNFTITQPAGPGDIRAWPQGSPPAVPTSIQNWGAANVTIANATFVTAGADGGITVQIAGASTHLIIDINGYTTRQYSNGGQFRAETDLSGGSAISGENFNNAPASRGVEGLVGTGTGVWGVYGLAYGASGSQSAGVHGQNLGTGAVARWGVLGTTASVADNAAGVKGIGGTGEPAGAGIAGSPGVLGVADSAGGVAGLSETRGVVGILYSSGGTFLTSGELATNVGTATNYGVFSFGNYGGTAMKFFVEPHPTDPSQVIRYVSLEGPEAGTYFRGRARFERGLARIAVPGHFRMVTDEEGLTVQITPIGEMTSFAVVKVGLDEIVVKGSRNVEFFYAVHGVRKGFKHFEPVGPGTEYVPRSADEAMPAYLSDAQKQSLVRNGTYDADGTVNRETAKRLGWDKKWRKGEAAAND